MDNFAAVSNLLQQGNYEQALALVEQQLLADQTNAPALAQKVKILTRMGQHRAALSASEQAVKQGAPTADLLNDTGCAMYALGMYREAARVYGESLDRDPSNVVVWSNKGDSLIQAGQYDQALACFERALGIKEDDVRAKALREKAAMWKAGKELGVPLASAALGAFLGFLMTKTGDRS